MWLGLFPSPTPIHVDVFSGVYGKRTVGIYRDKEQAGIGLNSVSERSVGGGGTTHIYQIGLVSHVQVVDDGGLVEMCELGHVVGFVEFGGIDLVHRLGVDVVLLAVVTLHEQTPSRQVFDDPASDESRLGIS